MLDRDTRAQTLLGEVAQPLGLEGGGTAAEQIHMLWAWLRVLNSLIHSLPGGLGHLFVWPESLPLPLPPSLPLSQSHLQNGDGKPIWERERGGDGGAGNSRVEERDVKIYDIENDWAGECVCECGRGESRGAPRNRRGVPLSSTQPCREERTWWGLMD